MRRLMLVSALFAIGAVKAEQLDTFRVTVADSARNFGAIAALPLPDSEIVTVSQEVGVSAQCPDLCIRLSRHDASGADGSMRLTVSGLSSVTAAAIDSQGRIVVIGETPAASKGGVDFGVLRFLPDGTDDMAFGSAGRARIGFDLGQSNSDKPTALAIDAKDSIVIVGSVERAASNDLDFGVVRLNGNDGSVDPGFGNNGKSVVSFNLSADYAFDIPYSVAIAKTGEIVIGGIANDSAIALDGASYLGHRPVLARLMDNGALDASFCSPGCNHNLYPSINSGRRVYYFGDEQPHADYISAIDVADTGDIVAAGTSYPDGAGAPKAVIARLLVNGDQLFERQEIGTDSYARYMAVRFADRDGSRIIAAGQSSMHTTGTSIGYFIVQAFKETLDFEKGYGGCLTQNSAICFSGTDNLDYGNNVARSLTLDAQGRPLFAGTFRNQSNMNNGVALFQRLTNTVKPNR
ncbi:MAG: hypothetical protein ABI411_09525 [Tahibacter sp.]